MQDILVELKNVSKSYLLGSTQINALNNISLNIRKGDFFAITGPSGCGKTTLLNIIGCIDFPSAGNAFVCGENISQLNDNKLSEFRLATLGFIFQSFNLIPVLSAIENIELPLLMMPNTSRKQAKKKAEKLLSDVEMTSHANHKPFELSGGQRQRVAIARALVTGPKIVLADEPTANLDSKTSQDVLNIMKKMNQEYSTTFIFSTHDPEVMTFSEKQISLKDGEIVTQ
jgi:putative ABC transport system ATP-binding protein